MKKMDKSNLCNFLSYKSAH